MAEKLFFFGLRKRPGYQLQSAISDEEAEDAASLDFMQRHSREDAEKGVFGDDLGRGQHFPPGKISARKNLLPISPLREKHDRTLFRRAGDWQKKFRRRKKIFFPRRQKSAGFARSLEFGIEFPLKHAFKAILRRFTAFSAEGIMTRSAVGSICSLSRTDYWALKLLLRASLKIRFIFPQSIMKMTFATSPEKNRLQR